MPLRVVFLALASPFVLILMAWNTRLNLIVRAVPKTAASKTRPSVSQKAIGQVNP